MNELFALAAVLLVIIAYVPYLVKIARGEVKPHPFTWLVWTITATSIFILQTKYGSGTGAYATAAMAFCALNVFIFTVRKGMPKVHPLDAICLVIALLGVAVWLVIDEPVVSIAILLSVEVIGFIPTFAKGVRKPYEDSAVLWALTVGRHSMGLLAIEHYNIVTSLNPITWIIVGSLFCITLLVRRIPVRKPKQPNATLQPYTS